MSGKGEKKVLSKIPAKLAALLVSLWASIKS